MFINKIFLVFSSISDSLDDVHVNSKHLTAADCQGNNNNMHILLNFKLLYTGTSETIKSIGSVDERREKEKIDKDKKDKNERRRKRKKEKKKERKKN